MAKTNRNSVEYCFNHTKERMLERHYLDITRNEYDDLCYRYNSKLSVKIVGIEKDQHIFDTEFKNKKLRFVWSDKRKTITTVLPYKEK